MPRSIERTLEACRLHNRHERWGSDIEQAVQSVWLQLDCLSLANRAEVNPHRKGLIECREKLDALLRIEQ